MKLLRIINILFDEGISRMKIMNQIIINDYVVIEVSNETYFGNYALIDGKEYLTEIVYDLPNRIAIKSKGDFVGKEVSFHD